MNCSNERQPFRCWSWDSDPLPVDCFPAAEGFPTRSACRVAGVTRQGFYAWQQRGRDQSVENRAEVELVARIRRIRADSGGAYGSPRVCAQLRRQGVRVNHKRVEPPMRINGICGSSFSPYPAIRNNAKKLIATRPGDCPEPGSLGQLRQLGSPST